MAARPQLDDGFLRIINTLYEACVSFELSEGEQKIVHLVIRETYGWGRLGAYLSLSHIKKRTGMNERTIRRAMDRLTEASVLLVYEAPNFRGPGLYGIEKKWDRWNLKRLGQKPGPWDKCPGLSPAEDALLSLRPPPPITTLSPPSDPEGTQSPEGVGVQGGDTKPGGGRSAGRGEGRSAGGGPPITTLSDTPAKPDAEGIVGEPKDSLKTRLKTERRAEDIFGDQPELFDGTTAPEFSAEVCRSLEQVIGIPWRPTRAHEAQLATIDSHPAPENVKRDALEKSLSVAREQRDWALREKRKVTTAIDKSLETMCATLAQWTDKSTNPTPATASFWSTKL